MLSQVLDLDANFSLQYSNAGIQIYHGNQCFRKVWMDCVKKISKCHKFLQFLADHQKVTVWTNRMKIGRGAEFQENCKIGNFAKCTELSPKQTQGIGHQKYPTYVHCSTPSRNFLSISLYDQPFSRYSTFKDFPIESHFKFQSATFFLKIWPIARKVIACIPPWQPMFS